MWHDGGSGWWMVWGMIMMLLFWGGLIALLVWGIQALVRRDQGATPLEVAKERLARGEITVEEFEQIKQALAVK